MNTEPTTVPSLLRLPEVKNRVGLGRSTIYAMIAANEFPSPIKISGRAVAWPSNQIDEWILNRLNIGVES